MVLVFVGLGLYDEKDVTVRGLEEIKSSDYVYVESYTATLSADKNRLSSFYGKDIIEADRQMVESNCEEILQRSEKSKVAFLVVGDPLCATTHGDLFLRARKRGIKVQVVHNASIMNAVAACGQQLYRFGECVSLPFFDSPGIPNSYYPRIARNRTLGLHTLCLLDIRVKEQTVDNLMKENGIFEPPRFMTIGEAIQQLFFIEAERHDGACAGDVKAFGLARVGSEDEVIRSGTLTELAQYNGFGGPLHSLVICAADLHEIEEEFYEAFHTKQDQRASS